MPYKLIFNDIYGKRIIMKFRYLRIARKEYSNLKRKKIYSKLVKF